MIGSAGGPDKAKKLATDFGFDVAIDYHAGPIAEQLTRAAPQGIDVYVDNVGGDHLAAAIGAARAGARFALVGAISSYNATGPVPGPDNLFQAYWKEVTLRGMLVTSYFHRFPEWIERASGWLARRVAAHRRNRGRRPGAGPGRLPRRARRRQHRQDARPPRRLRREFHDTATVPVRRRHRPGRVLAYWSTRLGLTAGGSLLW